MLAVALAVVSCHIVYASGQSVSGELSADGKILTVNVAGGEVKSFDPSTLLADGSVVTNVVKTGAGRLDVPSSVDISSYMGGITVEGGTYRCENPNALGCWNSDDAGVFKVLEDAAVEFSPPEGLVFKSDKKRFSVSGRGPAGDGAVIYSPASGQTGGTALGSELYLAGGRRSAERDGRDGEPCGEGRFLRTSGCGFQRHGLRVASVRSLEFGRRKDRSRNIGVRRAGGRSLA